MKRGHSVTLTRLIIAVKKTLAFFKLISVSPYHLVVPGLLSIIAVIFEGIGFGLLVPLVRGLISGKHDASRDLPVLGGMINWAFGIFGERQAVAFAVLLLIVFVSILLKNIFRYYAVVLSFFFVRQFADNLRRKLYERYLQFGKPYFDSSNVGHLYQVLMEMPERVAIELKAVETAFYCLVMIAVYFLIMTWISLPLTIFSAVVFPIIFFGLRYLAVKIGRNSHRFTAVYRDLGAKVSNSLSCVPLIKAQANEACEREWFADASDQVRRLQNNIDRQQAMNIPLQEVIMIAVIMLVVAVMAVLSHRGQGTDVAGCMVFFVLLRRSSSNLTTLGNMIVSFAGITGPFREIFKVFDDSDKHVVPDGRSEFIGLKNELRLNHLTFAYPGSAVILRGIDLVIDRGSTVAVVGGSGGGKTTLIGLLMRFYDAPAGSILADGADIRGFTLASWCSKIALVSQENYLLNTTIRANLLYGLKRIIDDDEVMRAVEKARLSDLMARLPSGLDSQIGDRGVKLSGGERQRISIARAILKNADIVILDEATSALDSITEKLIQEALNELVRDRTTIMIAHRLSTIEHANKVAVLEEGAITEMGTRQELLDRKGKFYQYWQKQHNS